MDEVEAEVAEEQLAHEARAASTRSAREASATFRDSALGDLADLFWAHRLPLAWLRVAGARRGPAAVDSSRGEPALPAGAGTPGNRGLRSRAHGRHHPESPGRRGPPPPRARRPAGPPARLARRQALERQDRLPPGARRQRRGAGAWPAARTSTSSPGRTPQRAAQESALEVTGTVASDPRAPGRRRDPRHRGPAACAWPQEYPITPKEHGTAS